MDMSKHGWCVDNVLFSNPKSVSWRPRVRRGSLNSKLDMKVLTVIGARPQFIKASVVSRVIRTHNRLVKNGRTSISEVIVHTGQHFHSNMSEVFFQELDVPEPEYNLGVNNAPHGAMTGRMLERVEAVLMREEPDWVLVYGDTNSTLAGSLAAAKLHIPLAHVEAGLRSFNMGMPEEVNRVVTDRLSSLLFCPSETAVRNLKREGISNIVQEGGLVDEQFNWEGVACKWPMVVNVGDVMYDSVLFNLERVESQSSVLEKLGLVEGAKIKPFFLLTVHREENTNDSERLMNIVVALKRLSKEAIVIWPMHPRTRDKIFRLNSSLLAEDGKLVVVNPVSYLDMIMLEKWAKLIFTDSGGMQKEAYFLGTPCVTLRDETEWVELIGKGVNLLAGANTESIVAAAEILGNKDVAFTEPLYGRGKAGEMILYFLLKGDREWTAGVDAVG